MTTEGPREGVSQEPSRRRSRSRRFRFGFFIRKIVDGIVTYYRSFPPTRRQNVAAAAPGPPPPPPPGGQEKSAGNDGPVLRAASHPRPDDDTGPIGGTRVEAGIFFQTRPEPDPDPEEPDDDP